MKRTRSFSLFLFLSLSVFVAVFWNSYRSPDLKSKGTRRIRDALKITFITVIVFILVNIPLPLKANDGSDGSAGFPGVSAFPPPLSPPVRGRPDFRGTNSKGIFSDLAGKDYCPNTPGAPGGSKPYSDLTGQSASNGEPSTKPPTRLVIVEQLKPGRKQKKVK